MFLMQQTRSGIEIDQSSVFMGTEYDVVVYVAVLAVRLVF